MQYAEFALAWESRRLGDKRAMHRLKMGMEDALSAYAILFPDKSDTMTETNAILKVAQAVLVQCFVHPSWESYVWFVAFGRSEMTLRDARGIVMEKESREARQSARNNVIL